MKNLVEKLNNELSKDFKIHFDMIHSTEAKCKENAHIRFLGYADSINKDIATVPHDIITKVSTNKKLINILYYINKKIFTAMLNYLTLKKRLPSFTLVRLRIAVNLIEKEDELTKEEKDEWVMQLQNTYHERKRVMTNYYLTEIEMLPF